MRKIECPQCAGGTLHESCLTSNPPQYRMQCSICSYMHTQSTPHGDDWQPEENTKTMEQPQPQVLPAPKTPDQLFTEWLTTNSFVAQAVLTAPKGGAVNPENFFPDDWRLVISVVEAKRNGV